MSPKITLRPETAEDEPFLYQLYATTRDYEMKLIPWDEVQKQAFLRQQCQLQLHHYRRYYGDANFDIILLDERPVGRLYVHRGPSEIRLMDISLLREYRGVGIGGQLTQQLIAEAQANSKLLTLHVELMNPARRLYDRLGFRLVADKGNYLYMEWQPDPGTIKRATSP